MSSLPDIEAFRALSQKCPGRLIPVARRFLADTLTPVEAFRRLGQDPYGFLLESVERGERVGRYSFVGTAPEVIFRGDVLPKPRYIEERPGQPPGPAREGDVFAAVERHLAGCPALPPDPALGVPPFAGGAVGFLGYDIVRLFEPRLFRRPPARRGLERVPDVLVPMYRTIVAFDHVKNVVFVVHHADPREGGAEAAYRRAQARISQVVERLIAPGTAPLTELAPVPGAAAAPMASTFTREAFLAAVRRAQEYITAGDVIQVVLSQRFSRETAAAPFEVYRSLRAVNPSPYMFYLRAPEVHLVGSSPEVMVRLQDGLITVRPIAGTRPRGASPEADAALAAELAADPKERAEHVMLLDLGRNDVGRVAEFRSVEVTERMAIEYYSHVMHIVSNVSGRLRPGLQAGDVLRACHPAGTVSGAPKIRAMEIIDELEPDSRGPYAGAVGVLDLRGNLNTCIAIRTIIMEPREDGRFLAHVQAGAGIVADSVPEREYEETQNKARALLRALEAAEARSGTVC
jgi:anthranilate synthase component 1